MWIKHPISGVVVLVLAPEHIARLLGEGGREVADPTTPVSHEQEGEQAANVHPIERPAHKKEAKG